MAETSVRLSELYDAVPKFRAAAADIDRVVSTVNGVLSDVADIVGSRQYTPADYEYPVIALAEALERAIRDYEEALSAPVGRPGDPYWQHLPDEKAPHDGDTHPHWPDGKPPKDQGKGKDKDKDNSGGNDSHSSSAGGNFPSSSSGGSTEDEEDNTSPPGQQQGNQGQSGGQGQGQPGGNAGQSGNQGDPNDSSGQSGAAAGGIFGAVIGALGLNKKSGDEEEAEEPEEVEEYVSAQNAPVKQELDEKKALLQETEARLTQLQGERAEKAALLDRLQATAAANPNADSDLEERIAQLKKELTEIDTEIYYGNEDIPRLREEVEALQKRLDIFQFGPDADWDAIRGYEGGETSIWIREATRNEDNSVNCVNYVVNRMPIPPELPFNAHLWDEQVLKHGSKYGITIGDVPMEGSVIVMEREHSYANDIYGHVMYVERVDANGVVWVTDNNYMDKPVRLDDLTNELSGPYIHYLYFPWQTKV